MATNSSRVNTISTTVSQAATLCASDGVSEPTSPDAEFKEFLKLFKREAELNKKDLQDYETTTIEDVKATIVAIQQRHISNNKQQYMRRLQVFLVNMEGYGKVIEVFLNSTEYLAFVWGPMKFMLLTACNYSEAFNSLLDAYLQIGELLPQLQAYQQHSLSDSYMRTVLALMYKDILEFHGTALKYFRKPTWKKLFTAVWSGFLVKLREIREKMERHKHLIESQASIVQFQEAQKFRETVESNFRELRDEFVRRKWPDVHRWLSPYNSALEHNNCIRAKAESPGSGQWVLKHSQFKDWYDPHYCLTPLLWLNGIPGAGKTILASTIIESLETLSNSTPIRFAYFYCKDGDPNRNTFVAVARGLLSQLLRDNSDLLLHLYDKGNLKSGEAILTDPEMAKDLLEVALDSAQKPTYIVIDGIDECSDRTERKLICSWFIKQVNGLPREDLGNLRCLFVSRKDGPAIKDLGLVPSIELRPVDTRDDIRNYLMAWAKKIEQKFGPLDPKECPLVDTLMASTQGMFLFAKLAVRYLYQLNSREVLLDSVHPGHFAEEIGKMYDKILAQIFDVNTPSPKKKAISRLLSLLVCAKRPLRWYEIQGFFAFDPDDEARPVDHEFRKLRDDPTDLCLSLIEWHPDNSVQLVHPTARDHLVKNKTHVSRHVAEFEITEHILAFLSSFGMENKLQLEETRNFVRKGYYSFLDYSVAYWAVHLQVVAGDRCEIANDRFEELTELLNLYIDARWVKSDAETDFATSATMNEKLKAFEAIDCFPRLVYATIFARKQLSIHGRGPSPEEPLDLSQLTLSVRKIQEELHDNPHERDNLRAFYGTHHFKCNRVNCIRFYDGYSTADERDRHINKHNRPFSCGIPDCSMAMVGYSTEKGLQKHMFELHGLDPGSNVEFPLPPRETSGTKQKAESVFKCTRCPKKFTRAFNLRNHLRTHENSKPFQCRVASCVKSFARPNDRKRHELTHGEGEGRKTFVCFGMLSSGANWGCKKSFARADKLRDHFNSLAGRRCRAPLHADQEGRGADANEPASGASAEAGTLSLYANHTQEDVNAPPSQSAQDIFQAADEEMNEEEWEALLESMVYLDEGAIIEPGE